MGFPWRGIRIAVPCQGGLDSYIVTSRVDGKVDDELPPASTQSEVPAAERYAAVVGLVRRAQASDDGGVALLEQAFPTLQALAHEGHPLALGRLGRWHLHGVGPAEFNPGRAYVLLRHAVHASQQPGAAAITANHLDEVAEAVYWLGLMLTKADGLVRAWQEQNQGPSGGEGQAPTGGVGISGTAVSHAPTSTGPDSGGSGDQAEAVARDLRHRREQYEAVLADIKRSRRRARVNRRRALQGLPPLLPSEPLPPRGKLEPDRSQTAAGASAAAAGSAWIGPELYGCDHEAARTALRLAASLGRSDALVLLGNMAADASAGGSFVRRAGVSKGPGSWERRPAMREACRWWALACGQAATPALEAYAGASELALIERGEDAVELAAAGHGDALYNLAMHVYSGVEAGASGDGAVPADPALAAALFCLGALPDADVRNEHRLLLTGQGGGGGLCLRGHADCQVRLAEMLLGEQPEAVAALLGTGEATGEEPVLVCAGVAARLLQAASVRGHGGASLALSRLFGAGAVPAAMAQLDDTLDLESTPAHASGVDLSAVAESLGQQQLESKLAMWGYLARAVEQEEGEALFEMGCVLLSGEEQALTGPPNPRAALVAFLQGAERLEHVGCLLNAGSLLRRGVGGEAPALRKAFMMYQRAAELGSIEGWRNVAAMYAAGEGVPQSDATAKMIMETVEKHDAVLGQADA